MLSPELCMLSLVKKEELTSSCVQLTSYNQLAISVYYNVFTLLLIYMFMFNFQHGWFTTWSIFAETVTYSNIGIYAH